MPRKVKLKHGVVPENPLPHRERSTARLKEVRAKSVAISRDTRANGERFIRGEPSRMGQPRNRAQGMMPVRLESMLMQVGPSAMTFLHDVITGVIPGATLQQRIDSATSVVTMMAKVNGDQMSAFAILTRNLDLSKLSDEQLLALQRHQDDVGAMVAALVDTSYTESRT